MNKIDTGMNTKVGQIKLTFCKSDMIESQSKRQIPLFEAVVNNYSTLQRCLLLVCVLIAVSATLFIEKSNIALFLFSSLPVGIGLSDNVIAPLIGTGVLAIACSFYFSIICSDKMPLQQGYQKSGFLSELRVTLVFGACLGLLTAILCSLIFVIAEPHLPQAFLKYHQLFSTLDFSLIGLAAVCSSTLYLSVFLLPMSLLLSTKFATEHKLSPFSKTTNTIVISSVILSFIMALLVAFVTAILSINLFIFIVLIFLITFLVLGLLYCHVSVEASLIANLVYCLLVSYLAHIFL